MPLKILVILLSCVGSYPSLGFLQFLTLSHKKYLHFKYVTLRLRSLKASYKLNWCINSSYVCNSFLLKASTTKFSFSKWYFSLKSQYLRYFIHLLYLIFRSFWSNKYFKNLWSLSNLNCTLYKLCLQIFKEKSMVDNLRSWVAFHEDWFSLMYMPLLFPLP